MTSQHSVRYSTFVVTLLLLGALTAFTLGMLLAVQHASAAPQAAPEPAPGSPSISISDTTVTEGDAGQTNAVFTLTLDITSTRPVTASYATQDDTATAGSDYLAASDTVTFTPGVTTQFIDVSVAGDSLDELNETFTVTLSNETNAILADDTAIGTIIDDDQASIAISDAAVTEGDAGQATATFTVTLSAPSDRTVTVDYATTDDTATAGSDYSATSGTLTFTPGTTVRTLDVSVFGDEIDENDETFLVRLEAPTGGATIADNEGVGTINDDDTTQISIADSSVIEGEASHVPIVFTVTLSIPSQNTVTVDYTTVAESASQGVDYRGDSGTLTFLPGNTTQFVTITVFGDTEDEDDETFRVTLENPNNASLFDGQAIGTIVDDDPKFVYIPLTIKSKPCPTEEDEPNDRISQANERPQPCEGVTIKGQLPSGDNDDLFRIEVEEAGNLRVNLTDIPSGVDYDLFVYNSAIEKLGESREFGNTPEEIVIENIQPGTYYLRVYPFEGRSTEDYALTWRLE